MTYFLNSLREEGSLDSSLNMACITVIPKPGQDPSEVSNYRPISLINNNLKLLTKILAYRLTSFIASIRIRWASFPWKQGPDQICRAIDIISLLRVRMGWGSFSGRVFSIHRFAESL